MSGSLRLLQGGEPTPPPELRPIVDRVEQVLAGDDGCQGARIVSSAPGVLDVMGGITDYSGGNVIGVSFDLRIYVTVQARSDRKLVIHYLSQSNGTNDLAPQTISIPMAGDWIGEFRQLIKTNRQNTTDSENGDHQNNDSDRDDLTWQIPVVGIIHAMLVSSKISTDVGGVSIVIDGDMPASECASYRAATCVATFGALSELWSLRPDPSESAHLAAKAENDLLDIPCGVSIPALATLVQSGSLAQIDPANPAAAKMIPLPEGVTFVGIDAGIRSNQLAEKIRYARTASFMGRQFIEAYHRSRGQTDHQHVKTLATIDPNTFKKVYSSHIPSNLKGGAFISRFGAIEDAHSVVDHSVTYKVRSRTEHHVYDGQRTRHFADLINTARQTNNGELIREAGKLMSRSHWSYTQRCGLVCVEAEPLVKNIHDHVESSGLHGARFSGYGCGGCIIAMMDNTDETHDLLKTIVAEYEQKSLNKTRILTGTGKGQQNFGVYGF